MLRLLNINTFYGEIHVLKNISLHIAEGEIVSLIGANGAGKTTLLNTISGIINARTGQIMYNNKDIARKSPDRVVKMGISQVPEGRQIFNPLTVLDIQKIVVRLKSIGIGVLITDHNVRETLQVTDRAYIINNGRIFRAGTPEELGNDSDVKRVYLGDNFRWAV